VGVGPEQRPIGSLGVLLVLPLCVDVAKSAESRGLVLLGQQFQLCAQGSRCRVEVLFLQGQLLQGAGRGQGDLRWL
jgi:hypothetical protein